MWLGTQKDSLDFLLSVGMSVYVAPVSYLSKYNEVVNVFPEDGGQENKPTPDLNAYFVKSKIASITTQHKHRSLIDVIIVCLIDVIKSQPGRSSATASSFASTYSFFSGNVPLTSFNKLGSKAVNLVEATTNVHRRWINVINLIIQL